MADPPRYPHSGDGTAVGPDRGSPPRMPRWVKVSGIIVIVLALLVAMMFIRGGQHGPGRHTPGGSGGQASSSNGTADVAPSRGGFGGHTLPEGSRG